MTEPAPDRFHAFDSLMLTLVERSLEHVRTELRFQLRATRTGAEVWRSSILHAPGGTCESGERFVGSLTSRQVIELLEEIERSGVYEALGTLEIVDGAPTDEPTVSMSVASRTREHHLFHEQPASHTLVHDLSEAVRRRVELAMEHALTCAG